MKKLITITLLFVATLCYSQNHIIGLNHKIDITETYNSENIDNYVSANWIYKIKKVNNFSFGTDLEVEIIKQNPDNDNFVIKFRSIIQPSLSVYTSYSIGRFEPNIRFGYVYSISNNDSVGGLGLSIGSYIKVFKNININIQLEHTRSENDSAYVTELLNTTATQLNLGVAIKL